MTQSWMRTLSPLALLCALNLGACQHSSDSVSARSGELENAAGIKIMISGVAELTPTQVHAISQSVEGKSQSVSAAMVRMEQDGEGQGENPASLEIELWGTGLPDSAVVISQLKADFPALADLQIEVVSLEPGSGPTPMVIEVDEEATAEEAKAQIIEALQADGVEGEIDVQIEDDDGERRIEVKVEQHEEIEG